MPRQDGDLSSVAEQTRREAGEVRKKTTAGGLKLQGANRRRLVAGVPFHNKSDYYLARCRTNSRADAGVCEIRIRARLLRSLRVLAGLHCMAGLMYSKYPVSLPESR